MRAADPLIGIAGSWGSTLRPHVGQVVGPSPRMSRQLLPSWVTGLSVEANARLASRDPVLRSYCDRAPLVAIGGLNQSPCRRGERHLYLEVLCRAFPATQFWALGQANPVVVNGLGCA